MNPRNFYEHLYEFAGGQSYGAQAQGDPWVITDTSSAGAPSYAGQSPTDAGCLALTLAADNEVENVCLSFGDILSYDIDKIRQFEWRLKTGAATMPTASSLAFGMASARNDAIDSIANALLGRVIGADSTTALVVESDDGTHDNDDVATGTTLINAFKIVTWDFSQGTSDVRIFVDGAPVAIGTTFDLSSYTGSLQPFVQQQKTASTNVPSVVLDYFYIRGVR